jgi:hypothetical protein
LLLSDNLKEFQITVEITGIIASLFFAHNGEFIQEIKSLKTKKRELENSIRVAAYIYMFYFLKRSKIFETGK